MGATGTGSGLGTGGAGGMDLSAMMNMMSGGGSIINILTIRFLSIIKCRINSRIKICYLIIVIEWIGIYK